MYKLRLFQKCKSWIFFFFKALSLYLKKALSYTLFANVRVSLYPLPMSYTLVFYDYNTGLMPVLCICLVYNVKVILSTPSAFQFCFDRL